MRDEMLQRLDALVAWSDGIRAEWAALRTELANERCENCACWDSDPSSAPQIKVPEETGARVCFTLTRQDCWSGDFHAEGVVITTADFGCKQFETKE
jgi:hypothetical protein